MYTTLLNAWQYGLCFLVFFVEFTASDNHNHDHVLCRKCGNEVSENYIENFFNITSPQSEHIKRVTLFGHPNVLVQSLRNPANNVFELVTVKVSGCKGVGEWYSEHTWFPGYAWKVCICPRCRTHLGWIFKPTDKLPSESLHLKILAEGFYGLIFGRLISEDFLSISSTMATELQENGMVKFDEDLLAELEAAAKDRYTEDDEDFMKLFNSQAPKPPILPSEPHQRNRRGGDRFRGNRRGGFRGGFRGGWQDRRSGGNRDDRRQDYQGGYRDDRRQGYGGQRDDRRQGYGGYRDDRRHDQGGNRDDRRHDYGGHRDDRRHDGGYRDDRRQEYGQSRDDRRYNPC